MSIDWSDEEQDGSSDAALAEPLSEGPPRDSIKTAPIAVIPESSPPKRSGPFRIYSPHDPDLTDDMRHEIEMHMTAGYWLHKAIQEEDRVEMPDEFRERNVIWKLVLEEAVVLVGFVVLGWLLLTDLLDGWVDLVILGMIAVVLVVGLYVYKLWTITYIVSTASKTGIYRERVRWMFINEIPPEFDTTAIIVNRHWRNKLFSTLDINWWRVYLDSAAQEESANVKTLRFVRDGDRLVQTIDKFKLALR